MSTDTWDRQQVRAFVKEVKARFGAGWEALGPVLQQMAVDAGVARVLYLQHRGNISLSDIKFLRNAMIKEAGLNKEQE